jgi:hypothetical protein
VEEKVEATGETEAETESARMPVWYNGAGGGCVGRGAVPGSDGILFCAEDDVEGIDNGKPNTRGGFTIDDVTNVEAVIFDGSEEDEVAPDVSIERLEPSTFWVNFLGITNPGTGGEGKFGFDNNAGLERFEVEEVSFPFG